MDTDKNNRLRQEFGVPRHRPQFGGGYQVSSDEDAHPYIKRIEVRYPETVLLGGKPSRTVYYVAKPPSSIGWSVTDMLADKLELPQIEEMAYVAYECRQTFWVTTGIQIDHEKGAIYDSGYYRIVTWYEWRLRQ